MSWKHNIIPGVTSLSCYVCLVSSKASWTTPKLYAYRFNSLTLIPPLREVSKCRLLFLPLIAQCCLLLANEVFTDKRPQSFTLRKTGEGTIGKLKRSSLENEKKHNSTTLLTEMKAHQALSFLRIFLSTPKCPRF